MTEPLSDRNNTLDELIAYQKEEGLGDVHLVNLRDEGFDVAHTDGEREAQMDLEDCPVHRWLMSFAGPPAAPGRYRVAEVDWPGKGCALIPDGQHG
jgi:Family of unknown function (DUF6085)